MGAREAFARAVAAAEAAPDHAEAGRRWIEAGRIAVDAGALPSARQALAKAGEAFRKDDRIADALRALSLARSYGPEPAEAALLDVQTAGLLAERGDLDGALGALDRAGAAPADLVRDTRAGLLLGHGRKADARREVAALGNPVARAFRSAQLARLDGDFAAAHEALESVIRALGGRPGAEAGLAGARMERAELALLEGRPGDALAICADAVREHAEAGRPALRFRAEAARARAAVAAGLRPFPGPVREGLAYASDRGLPLLAVELHLAAGTALAEADPAAAREHLTSALRDAQALRVPIAAGRARLALAALAAEPRPLLEAAARDLADHVPLRDRVAALLGRRRIPASAWRVTPWKNGRGTTTELAVDPPGADLAGFRWRLSTAAVVEEGAFSEFVGVDRTLVLLEGPRLELDVDGVLHVLQRPYDRVAFPGDVPTGAAVPEGPIRDLNLMVRRPLPHRAEVARGRVDLRGPTVLVVPLGGEIDVPGIGPVAPLEVVVAAEHVAFEAEHDALVAVLG